MDVASNVIITKLLCQISIKSLVIITIVHIIFPLMSLMTPKLTFYRVNYCTVLYMPYIYMDNIQFSAKHLISDALISEWIWKNTQQITGLPRHGARMSFDYKPGSGNINSSDTVVGQFSFR